MSALLGRSRAVGAIVALVSSLVLGTMTAGVASAAITPVAAAQTVGVGATSAYNVTVTNTDTSGGNYFAVTAVSGVAGVSVSGGGCTQVAYSGGSQTLAAKLSLTESVTTGTYNTFQVTVGKFANSACTGTPVSTATITAGTLTVDNYQIVFYKRYCSTYTRVPSNYDATGGYPGRVTNNTDSGGHDSVLAPTAVLQPTTMPRLDTPSRRQTPAPVRRQMWIWAAGRSGPTRQRTPTTPARLRPRSAPPPPAPPEQSRTT